MTTKKFNTLLKEGIENVDKYMADEVGLSTEPVNDWCGHEMNNVFHYAAQSQHCQELRLEENGHEREFTFMSDLSIAEWCGGTGAVLETTSRVMKEWKNNEHAMAEFVLSVNWKAWEMHARKKNVWSIFYSVLYEVVRDLVYDYYEGNDEKVGYVYDYLD